MIRRVVKWAALTVASAAGATVAALALFGMAVAAARRGEL